MAAVLRIIDEQFGAARERRPAGELRLASQRATAREIIEQRVASEVEEANRRRQAHREGHARTRSFLIDVGPAEARLNPALAGRTARPIDAGEETARALAAFEARRFLMLVDDRQADRLDEAFGLQAESEVVFLYLTPLKGG